MAFKRRRSYPQSVMTKATLSKTTLTQSHQTPSWLDTVSKDDDSLCGAIRAGKPASDFADVIYPSGYW